jgi:predicted Zn-dependent protease
MVQVWTIVPMNANYEVQGPAVAFLSPFKARLLPNRDYDSKITMDKIAMLTQILEQNPGDAFARYGLAMEHANQGQTDAALAEFDRLLSTHPDYTAGYFMAGQTLVKAGRTDEARQRLEQGIASARRTGNQHALGEMEALLEDLA